MENKMNSSSLIMYATDSERATFYRKTYTHVALAVLVFIGVEAVLLQSSAFVNFMLSLTQGYLWLVLLGIFWIASMVANRFTHSVSRPQQYLGLGLYILIEAIIFVPIIYIAIQVSGGLYLIKQAALVTLALFGGLSAVVFMTRTNFSFLRTAITIGAFVAMGAIVAGMIFGFNLGLWFSLAMVILAGAAILYQTSQLKYEYSTDQYVGAALGLFSSLMLLFWYILRIFMSRN